MPMRYVIRLSSSQVEPWCACLCLQLQHQHLVVRTRSRRGIWWPARRSPFGAVLGRHVLVLEDGLASRRLHRRALLFRGLVDACRLVPHLLCVLRLLLLQLLLSRVRSFASTAAFFVFSHAMMADSIFFSALRCVPCFGLCSSRSPPTP